MEDFVQARMVDIGEKADTEREAVAKGRVRMQPSTLKLLQQGELPKGDALAVAQVAGIMAAKRTPQLLPLCHPLLLTNVNVGFRLKDDWVEITATVKSTGKTGVEMEALTAVAVSALTLYDMCKQVDPGMCIEDIRLVRKSGGKSGTVELEG